MLGGRLLVRSARVAIIITPAASAELSFESFLRLAREGKVNRKGLANPIRMARLAHPYDVFLAGPPVASRRPLHATSDVIGRAIGYERIPTVR